MPASSTSRRCEDFPPEKWDAILAINLSSAFHTTRLALPGMLSNKWGRIINIASAHGLVASPFKSAYVAAKHGIVGLTKMTALETAEQGITCNAICPGYVWTPLVEAQIEQQAKAHSISRDAVIRDVLLAQQPNKRFATVEELGALAVFLAAMQPPRSPASRCRSMAAGPHTDTPRSNSTLPGRIEDEHPRKSPTDAQARRAAGAAGAAASSRSTSRCRAAAPTARSPGACSTACSKSRASRSKASARPAPAR